MLTMMFLSFVGIIESISPPYAERIKRIDMRIIQIIVKALIITVVLLLTFSAGIHVGKSLVYDQIREMLADPIE